MRAETTPDSSHRSGQPDHEATRAQVVHALQSIIELAEHGPLHLSERCSGFSVVLERDLVRCVLVISTKGPRRALSPREQEVARLVAEGATNRAIASTLDISLWTVSTHVRRIFAKLHVGSRAEMVAQLFGILWANTSSPQSALPTRTAFGAVQTGDHRGGITPWATKASSPHAPGRHRASELTYGATPSVLRGEPRAGNRSLSPYLSPGRGPHLCPHHE
jgi:DNA-binding CsgD family transcriptional regulator